ncbi:MAG: hypothetical protein ACRCYO_06090 [Bacteroidia bacterium]
MIQSKKNCAALSMGFLLLLSACQQTENKKAMEQPQMDSIAAPKKLEIKASANSSENDFDFLVGKWSVKNRKLKAVLSKSNEWTTFDSELHMRKTIGGFGNVENYYATFNEKPFEGMAVRLFNPKTKLWSVYWMDSNSAIMDEHPVSGSFESGIGKLYTRDQYNEQPVLVLYQWDATNPEHPKWSQALSTDDGKPWEWNWEMVLTRIP